MVRCDSCSFTQSVISFETDVASGSPAASVSVCLFVLSSPLVILVELLRQSPARLLQSVHRCDSTREFQKWRLQHEAADCISRQPHKWFRSHTEVSQDGRTKSAKEGRKRVTSCEETNEDQLFPRRLRRSQAKKLDPSRLLAEEVQRLKLTRN